MKQLENDMFTTKASFPIKEVVVLGSGPNRIGRSEFDYSCVHGVCRKRMRLRNHHDQLQS